MVLQLPDNTFLELCFLDRGGTCQKRFSGFCSISGPTGSGKPDASIEGKSFDQEEPNNTSNMKISPANPPAWHGHYSYFNQIWKKWFDRTKFFGRRKYLSPITVLPLSIRFYLYCIKLHSPNWFLIGLIHPCNKYCCKILYTIVYHYLFWMEEVQIKNVFPVFSNFRTSRFRKTGSVHPGRILGPRGVQGHLKHGNRSSRSLNPSVRLLLF